jgi:hypothetical protein
MSRFDPVCYEEINHPRIVFEENRSKIIFNNPEKRMFGKVEVDGCQVTDGIRCDFLLIEPNKEHFIELKGEDIEHATNQISRSIRQLSIDPAHVAKSSYIISSRSPLSSPEIQILKAKFRRDFNSELIVKNRILEVAV